MSEGILGNVLFAIVIAGAVLLNFTDPPWQTIGVIIFLGCLVYPLLLGLLRRER